MHLFRKHRKREGVGAYPPQQQGRRFHSTQRRLYNQQHTGCRRSFEIRRQPAQTDHHRRLHQRDRHSGGKPGQGTGIGDTVHCPRGLRTLRKRLSDAEEGTDIRVHAPVCPPAPAHQHLRGGDAHTAQHGNGHPHLLPRARLLLLPHSADYRKRLRRGGTDVPGDDKEPLRPEEGRGREDRLQRRLLRKADVAHRERPA